MYLEIPVKTNFEQELVDKRSKGMRHYMELYAEDTFVYIDRYYHRNKSHIFPESHLLANL